jgi:hypothetical protein
MDATRAEWQECSDRLVAVEAKIAEFRTVARELLEMWDDPAGVSAHLADMICRGVTATT